MPPRNPADRPATEPRTDYEEAMRVEQNNRYVARHGRSSDPTEADDE